MAADRVTSVAVARRAGVSQSTVSLVLSGKARGRVSAGTEEVVRRAADELGYRPNRAAQALRLGAARMVCLVVPDVTNPFFGQVMRGAAHAARAAGLEVALVDVDRDYGWADESLSPLAAGPVDGFLLFGLVPPPDARAERVVLIEVEARGAPSVRFAFEDGVRDAMAHLIGLGHRRIAHLASAVGEATFLPRVRAADEAAATAGLPAVTRVHSAIDLAAAAAAARALLTGAERPTAVICDDDIMAAGVCVAARELGLRGAARPLGDRLRRPAGRERRRPAADHAARRRRADRHRGHRAARRRAGGQAPATPHAAGRAGRPGLDRPRAG